MMTLLTIKVVAGLVILGIGVLGGIIPLIVAKHHTSRRFFSLGNALAGGIFLGVGFMHLLPEANEVLSELIDYPLAPLLAAAGVALLLWIDRVLFETARGSTTDESGEHKHKPIYPYVLLAALSIHSLVAGIALGLEPEIAASVLVMFGILLHKGSASFALMVSAHSSGMERKSLHTLLAIFVVMTPLGILLGTLASGMLEGEAAELSEGIFNAVAAGTFIYIAILDVIGAEMSRIEDRMARFVSSALIGEDDVDMPVVDTDRTLKFLLVIIGLGSMAVLGLWV